MDEVTKKQMSWKIQTSFIEITPINEFICLVLVDCLTEVSAALKVPRDDYVQIFRRIDDEGINNISTNRH